MTEHTIDVGQQSSRDIFKVRLWAVIGPPGSGKSSTIGALAGFKGRGAGGRRDIFLRGGGWLEVHAFRQSVQEANLDPQQSFDRTMNNARRQQSRGIVEYYNVLLAFRSDIINGLPTGDEYLKFYISNGWIIEKMALLDINDLYYNYARIGAPTCLVRDSTANSKDNHSRTWVFGEVRNHFGWA